MYETTIDVHARNAPIECTPQFPHTSTTQPRRASPQTRSEYCPPARRRRAGPPSTTRGTPCADNVPSDTTSSNSETARPTDACASTAETPRASSSRRGVSIPCVEKSQESCFHFLRLEKRRRRPFQRRFPLQALQTFVQTVDLLVKIRPRRQLALVRHVVFRA